MGGGGREQFIERCGPPEQPATVRRTTYSTNRLYMYTRFTRRSGTPWSVFITNLYRAAIAQGYAIINTAAGLHFDVFNTLGPIGFRSGVE